MLIPFEMDRRREREMGWRGMDRREIESEMCVCEREGESTAAEKKQHMILIINKRDGGRPIIIYCQQSSIGKAYHHRHQRQQLMCIGFKAMDVYIALHCVYRNVFTCNFNGIH